MDFKKVTSTVQVFINKSDEYWGLALAGEVGEACNLIKKKIRDKIDIKEKLSMELADIFNYLEIIARRYEIDLEEAILRKNEIVKIRMEKETGLYREDDKNE
jgi:NTP pyrophosphatase (non-canonical NTP hydrolase)